MTKKLASSNSTFIIPELILETDIQQKKILFYDVLFCKSSLSKVASIKTNKIKKTDTTFDNQLFMIKNIVPWLNKVSLL